MLPSSGPYEIRRPLGMGGMAETFVAVRRGPEGIDHTVCLKRVLPALAREPRFVSQFLDEARILSHLRHDNIVSLLDFGKDENGYYMALQLVDGVDLAQLLAAGPPLDPALRARVTAYVAASLCRALRYAHGLSIDGVPSLLVHRDISPSNVLLSRHGEVKLSDFGIAWTRERGSRTRTGQTKGKIAYMSPEQVRAEPLDARSDLFSLGVVMHELLLGRAPFRGRSELELMQRIAGGERDEVPRDVRLRNEGLWNLIDLLLATDRNLRVQSAGQALERLRELDIAHDAQDSVAQLVANHGSGASAKVTVSHPGLSGWHLQTPSVPNESRPVRRLPALVARTGSVAAVTLALTSSLASPSVPWRWPLVQAAIRASERRTVPSASAPTLTPPVSSEAVVPVRPIPDLRAVAAPVASLPSGPVARRSRPETTPEPAKVRIAVIPFGNVWVDGHETGASPLQITLAPGEHIIEVGRFDAPTARRQVRVVGGDERQETFDLIGLLEAPEP